MTVPSGDVLPATSVPDVVNVRNRDPEHLGQSGVGKVTGANSSHISGGQLGLSVALPARKSVSLNTVLHVIGVGSGSKVRGVNADRSITSVKNMKPIRDFPVVNLVGDSGRNDVDSLVMHQAVAVVIHRTGPVPASFAGRWSRHMPGKRVFLGKSFGPVSLDGTRSSRPRSLPSIVMRATPSSTEGGTFTVRNGTDTITHIDTHLSVVPRPVDAGAGRSPAQDSRR